MTININELRLDAKDANGWLIPMEISGTDLIEILDRLEAAEANAIEQARLLGMGASREAALMAKLEAAEKDIALKERIIDSLGAELNAVANERDALLRDNTALRVKVEAMEKQEPTMWANSSNIISAKINKERRSAGDQHTCSETKTAYHDAALYLAPGAKGE